MLEEAALIDAAPLLAPQARSPDFRCDVTQWRADESRGVIDTVVEETPVAVVYNGISHAVMLASPSDLEDFAVGFSLTERLVESLDEIYDIEVAEACDGVELQVTIASSRMAALKLRRRALAGRTGCGLCGVESLGQALQPSRKVAPGGRVRAASLQRALEQLAARQILHRATGAAHAAGFATWDGELMLLREDVGRHNALDKLTGAMATRRCSGDGGIAVITSRASYEMIHKTAAAGIRVLAALSAPTGLAIRAASECGITLIGFAGRERRMVYSCPERLDVEARD